MRLRRGGVRFLDGQLCQQPSQQECAPHLSDVDPRSACPGLCSSRFAGKAGIWDEAAARKNFLERCVDHGKPTCLEQDAAYARAEKLDRRGLIIARKDEYGAISGLLLDRPDRGQTGHARHMKIKDDRIEAWPLIQRPCEPSEVANGDDCKASFVFEHGFEGVRNQLVVFCD